MIYSNLPFYPYFVQALHQFVESDASRIVVTFLLVLLSVLCSRLNWLTINRSKSGGSADSKRIKLIARKNAIRVITGLAIFALWLSKLTGFALSVAALAGAILLVSKEYILCVMGYFLIRNSGRIKVGDFIEISGFSGRVIDIGVFSTTLYETGSVRQLTGKTLTFPNILFFSNPLVNSSATGQFIIDLYRMVVPLNVDFDEADRCAVLAADNVSKEWQHSADLHFKRIENDVFLDLPSARPKVLWESPNEKSHVMHIRFACPAGGRVAAEQEIFRQFWREYRKATTDKSKCAGCTGAVD